MLIPDKILLFFLIPLIVLRFLNRLVLGGIVLLARLLGLGLLFLIAVVSKGGMGGGDIKLFFVIGLVLGLGSDFTNAIFSFYYWYGYWCYFFEDERNKVEKHQFHLDHR